MFGLDGSSVGEEDTVVWIMRSNEFPDSLTGVGQIDYFHGCVGGTPIAQMQMMDGEGFYSTEMFSATNGHVARCITRLHRLLRERWAREVEAARVRVVVRLQALWRGRRARITAATRVGIVVRLQRWWRGQREQRDSLQNQILLDRAEADSRESEEPPCELFTEDGCDLAILDMSGQPTEIVFVRPETKVKEVKLLLERACGIPSRHQRYQWSDHSGGGDDAGMLPGEPLILGDSETMGKLGNPPALWMLIDVKRSDQLPFRRPRDDGLCELELMNNGMMCGRDGSIIYANSLVWIMRSPTEVNTLDPNRWPDFSTGLKRVGYFHSDEFEEPFAAMMTLREESFSSHEMVSAMNGHVVKSVGKLQALWRERQVRVKLVTRLQGLWRRYLQRRQTFEDEALPNKRVPCPKFVHKPSVASWYGVRRSPSGIQTQSIGNATVTQWEYDWGGIFGQQRGSGASSSGSKGEVPSPVNWQMKDMGNLGWRMLYLKFTRTHLNEFSYGAESTDDELGGDSSINPAKYKWEILIEYAMTGTEICRFRAEDNDTIRQVKEDIVERKSRMPFSEGFGTEDFLLMTPKSVYAADRRTFLSNETTVGLLGKSLDAGIPGSNRIVPKLYKWWDFMTEGGTRADTLARETTMKGEHPDRYNRMFDTVSDDNGNRFQPRKLYPEKSPDDAEAVATEARRQSRLEEIAASRPVTGLSGRCRGTNDRPSPNTSDEERPLYDMGLNSFEYRKRSRAKMFHANRRYWRSVIDANQRTHRTLLREEGSDISPNAPFFERGFQNGPGLPAQQHGDWTMDGPQTWSNKIACNPYVIGTCSNCARAYGDITMNSRTNCYIWQGQMCMKCSNEESDRMEDDEKIIVPADETVCRGCRGLSRPVQHSNSRSQPGSGSRDPPPDNGGSGDNGGANDGEDNERATGNDSPEASA